MTRDQTEEAGDSLKTVRQEIGDIVVILGNETLSLFNLLHNNRAEWNNELQRRLANKLGLVTGHQFVRYHERSIRRNENTCLNCGRMRECHYYIPQPKTKVIEGD